MSGSGGSAGDPIEPDDTVPECDPESGEPLDNTPYPGCEPANPADPDPCEACIQEACCEQSIACYSFAPGNVCGWGGPESGDYSGAGEIGCYVQCLADYTEEFGVCDSDGRGMCEGLCQTLECGAVLGNQTSELAGCMHDNCSAACFGSETCD
jgi:hypothetical protein